MSGWLTLAAIVVALLAVWAVAFFIIGHTYAQKWWENEMIVRGHARYHFFNAKWYWNEDLPKDADPIAYKVRAQQDLRRRQDEAQQALSKALNEATEAKVA